MSEEPLSKKSIFASEKSKNIAIVIFLVILSAVCFAYVRSKNVACGKQPESLQEESKVAEAKSTPEQETIAASVLGEKDSIIPSEEDIKKKELEGELREMVAGYPIEEMVPYIAEYDREVASLIIGIGKKESNWGKRSPSKGGKTCYNYWGYKGAGTAGIAMGHGCFSTPEEGVKVIAKRIEALSAQGLNTPSELLVWKCGRSCAGHAPGTPEKWVSDVSIYYNRIMKG